MSDIGTITPEDEETPTLADKIKTLIGAAIDWIKGLFGK